MTAADWIARTLLLVLAGGATLLLIGGIASIPGDVPSAGTTAVVPPGELPVTDPAPSRQVAGESVAPPPAAARADAWLEPLTYAVIALAGFVAAGLLVLMRIAGHLGEIARRDEW